MLQGPEPSSKHPSVGRGPCGQPGHLRGGSDRERLLGLASQGCFPSESPPTQFPNRIPSKQNASAKIYRGFISRQKKTKAISSDTNVDECVDRKPTDWQIKPWLGLASVEDAS